MVSAMRAYADVNCEACAGNRDSKPMILLHLVVAALYGYAAWALRPTAAAPAQDRAPPGSLNALRLPPTHAVWLVPVALALHAWLLYRTTVVPGGLDFGLDNAVSLVAGLVVLLAWLAGLLRILPTVSTVVLPIAAAASLLPAVATRVHRFTYATQPWAAVHVAIALIAYALFIVAGIEALVLLVLERRLRRHLPEGPVVTMPPLLTLERYMFRLVVIGFVLLTLALLSGSIFSEEIFGQPLRFTHKSVFSVLAWLTFGGFLLGHWRYGWRGRVAVRWIVTGTVFLLLAYFGSKFVLEVLLGR